MITLQQCSIRTPYLSISALCDIYAKCLFLVSHIANSSSNKIEFQRRRRQRAVKCCLFWNPEKLEEAKKTANWAMIVEIELPVRVLTCSMTGMTGESGIKNVQSLNLIELATRTWSRIAHGFFSVAGSFFLSTWSRNSLNISTTLHCPGFPPRVFGDPDTVLACVWGRMKIMRGIRISDGNQLCSNVIHHQLD
jgi:hypothetical protein